MQVIKTLTFAAVLFGAAAAAGCQTDKSSMTDFFPAEEEQRVQHVAQIQAASGARADATLQPFHFDGGKLNSLGEAKLDLMMKETYQEREEAVAKLQRAKLSSCQLPTYLVGWRDWIRVREAYQRQAGADFSLAGFHEKALKEGAVPLPVLLYLKSPLLEQVELFLMRVGTQPALNGLDLECEHPQPALPGEVGVELAQPSGCRIAWVRQRRFTSLFPLAVYPNEGIVRHVHFAANLDHGRMSRSFERQRDIGDGLEIGGDVLADHAVAPRGAHRETTTLVREAHGRPIDLNFGGITGAQDLSDESRISLFPGGQLLG